MQYLKGIKALLLYVFHKLPSRCYSYVRQKKELSLKLISKEELQMKTIKKLSELLQEYYDSFHTEPRS